MINAIIRSVEIVTEDVNEGMAKLTLRGKSSKSYIYVVNPPKNINAFRRSIIGIHIFNSGKNVMIDNKVWAVRRGYSHIELLTKQSEMI